MDTNLSKFIKAGLDDHQYPLAVWAGCHSLYALLVDLHVVSGGVEVFYSTMGDALVKLNISRFKAGKRYDI